MDLDLTDDQVALRDGIASMLAARVPVERVRAGFDRELFAELAEAGVFSLRADGFSWADCAVVFEQLGRACVPGPLVPSLLVSSQAGGDGRVAGVLEGGWVEFPDALDVVVVPGVGTCAPPAGELSPWPLDPATPVARVEVVPPCDGGTGIDWDEWRRAGAVLTAALQVGLADRCTELSVEYAKERVQFDRPIGSFQAVKHLLADMCMRTEVARAAVYAAASSLDEDPDDRAISVAKAIAGETAIANGKAATQVHGGMGFTWEVDVHLYLKRAWVLDTHFGTAEHHFDAVAASL